MADLNRDRATNDRIDRVLAESLGGSESLDDNTQLEGLGVDSLGAMSLLMSLEDEFGFLIPVERLAKIRCVRTIGDLRTIAAEVLAEEGGDSP